MMLHSLSGFEARRGNLIIGSQRSETRPYFHHLHLFHPKLNTLVDSANIKPCESLRKMEIQGLSRMEKRKAAKKQKRKQMRTETAMRQREEEEARLNDPEEQARIRLMESEEAERWERDRREFEERERMWIEATAERKRRELAEEEERRKILEELEKKEVEKKNELSEDDDWNYVEEGPAEILWQGNEIIVKKKRVRVAKRDVDQHSKNKDTDRPTSNPLPPQSQAFSEHIVSVISSQNLSADVSEQIPNFGTEQDKAHCPFHFKTGACRFGQRCSRVHFYPDKSCTLLIKNMYNGPGLAWEQDEGLEYTDEEIERCYEEFYEDVHTEFLKFGEIVNFKVCRNGSFHLRGNVYVHYKFLDSAVLAYHSINGRYFAGKQVTCEFIGVTRWKVAICGEYMKSRFKTCSHGTACNFIHCFRNPGGDYEWADWDKPPPRYWVKKMVALFGLMDECGYDKEVKQESLGAITADVDRYHSRRSRSRERAYPYSESTRRQYDENYAHKNKHKKRHASNDRNHIRMHEEGHEKEAHCGERRHRSSRNHSADSEGNLSDGDRNRDTERHNSFRRKSSRQQGKGLESPDHHADGKHKAHDSEQDWSDWDGDKVEKCGHTRKSSKHQKEALRFMGDHGDIKNIGHEPDSEGDLLDMDEDHDQHHNCTMKSSKNKSKVSEFSDDRRHSRCRTRATDSSNKNSQGDRYHNHRRKSSRHWDEVSETAGNNEDKRKRTDIDPAGGWSGEIGERNCISRRNHSSQWSDDHEEPEKNMTDAFHCHSFDTEKPDCHPGRKVDSSRVDFCSEDQKSNENHGTSSPGQNGRRSESYNLDSGYNCNENSDKQDTQEPRKHQTSRRGNTSHGPYSGYYSGDTVDKGHSWESGKHLPDKCHKKRDGRDFDKSRPRGRDQSTHIRHSSGLNDEDASEEYQDSEEKGKRHGEEHGSGSHRRHRKKSKC